jgi:lipoprotein-releasing system ATP-binding protein
MIRIEGVNKHYGNLHVLKDIDLEINTGEIVTIVGPSGAGKTTLLQIAGTLDRADSGRVLYGGEDVSRLNDKKLSAFRNANIGFIFQFHRLLPEFTALENTAMPAMIAGMSLSKAKKRGMELLEALGIADRAAHKPNEMSGGECQRVAIARALVNSPQVIFGDEPTGSLDSANREEIQRLIVDLRDRFGQTFVIVTHDMSLPEIADRTISMSDGRIILPPAEPEISVGATDIEI